MPDSDASTSVESLAEATVDTDLAAGTDERGAPETPPAAPTLEQLQQELKRAKGGQAAEQRRAAELQKQLEQQQGQLNQMWDWQRQQAAAAQARPAVNTGRDGFTAEERKRYQNAIIDGNDALVEELGAVRDDRNRQKMLSEFEERSRLASIATQSASSFQTFINREAPELSDPASPISQEILTRYRQLVIDPAMSWNLGQAVQTPNGPQYPTVLAIAIKDVKARHAASKAQSGVDAVGEDIPNVERNSRPASRQTPKFSYMKHLTEAERDYVSRIKTRQDASYTPERYWDRLPDAERKRRLSGKMPEA